MVESTPLLDDDDNTPHDDGNNNTSQKTPASAHFKSLIKVLAVTTLVLSLLTMAFLIANYIILSTAPFGNPYYGRKWVAKYESNGLAKVVFASLLFAAINVIFNFPILLNVIVDIVLAACTIPKAVRLIELILDPDWCREQSGLPIPRPIPEPIPEPNPKCEHWTLVVKVLMGIIAGFSLLICVVYLVQLGFRIVALYRVKIWKKPLSYTFPAGEYSLQINLRVLRHDQESGGQNIEARAESRTQAEHGPVYL